MNKCPVCNKDSGFRDNGIEKIFCSNECKVVDKRTGRMKPCLTCKKDFYVRPCEDKTKKYCSNKCRGQHFIPRPEKRNGIFIECPTCLNKKYVQPSVLKLNKTGVKFCSIKCKGIAMSNGLTQYGFKDEGSIINSNSYKRIQVNKKRVKEHRYIMEQHLGRILSSNEMIHHINGNPKDNRIENLMIVTNKEHGRLHKSKKTL